MGLKWRLHPLIHTPQLSNLPQHLVSCQRSLRMGLYPLLSQADLRKVGGAGARG